MSKVNLIGISGRIGAGKDAVAAIIQYILSKEQRLEVKDIVQAHSSHEWWLEEDSGWEIKKYAYKLKQIAAILLGCDPWEFENQEFKKSELGSEWDVEVESNEQWYGETGYVKQKMTVRSFLQRLGTEALRSGLHEQTWINALFADYTEESKWIITDVRYPNEYEAIKQRGGVLIRVERGERNKDAHISETALDDFKFDYVLDNNGNLDELKEKVSEVLKEIL